MDLSNMNDTELKELIDLAQNELQKRISKNVKMSQKVRLVIEGNTCKTYSYYNEKFINKAKKNLKGRWNRVDKAWEFPLSIVDNVKRLLVECFGTDGTTPYPVSIVEFIINENISGLSYHTIDRLIVKKYGSGHEFEIQDDVYLIEGEIGRKNVNARFELHNVATSLLEREENKKLIDEGIIKVKNLVEGIQDKSDIKSSVEESKEQVDQEHERCKKIANEAQFSKLQFYFNAGRVNWGFPQWIDCDLDVKYCEYNDLLISLKNALNQIGSEQLRQFQTTDENEERFDRFISHYRFECSVEDAERIINLSLPTLEGIKYKHEKLAAKFQKAKETGKPVLISSYQDSFDDYNHDMYSGYSYVKTYAMPDGSTEEEIEHVYS